MGVGRRAIPCPYIKTEITQVYNADITATGFKRDVVNMLLYIDANSMLTNITQSISANYKGLVDRNKRICYAGYNNYQDSTTSNK